MTISVSREPTIVAEIPSMAQGTVVIHAAAILPLEPPVKATSRDFEVDGMLRQLPCVQPHAALGAGLCIAGASQTVWIFGGAARATNRIANRGRKRRCHVKMLKIRLPKRAA